MYGNLFQKRKNLYFSFYGKIIDILGFACIPINNLMRSRIGAVSKKFSKDVKLVKRDSNLKLEKEARPNS